MSEPKPPVVDSSRLAISLLGSMSVRDIEDTLGAIYNSGCNIENHRLTDMGGLTGMLSLVTGNWGAIAKCEEILPRMAEERGLSLHMIRLQGEPQRGKTLPYAIDLIAPDQPGILRHIVRFVKQYDMRVRDIQSVCYTAPESESRLFSAHINLQVPETMSIAAFRSDFNDLCDRLNLDAIIEPVK